MISDQQLATREHEIAKLFLGLQTATHERSGHHAAMGRADQPVPTPAQRIEQILRRAEEERNTSRRLRPCDSPAISTRRHYPSD